MAINIGTINSPTNIDTTNLVSLCCYMRRVLPMCIDDELSMLELYNKMICWAKYATEFDETIAKEWDDFKNAFDADLSNTITDILNQWLADGTLSSMISVFVIDTMDNALDFGFQPSTHFKTQGYHSVGDGGDGVYHVVEDSALTENKGTIVKLSNGYFAVIDNPNNMNLQQFGCYGDGTHDDTISIQNALNSCDVMNGVEGKNYLISSVIEIPYGHSFDGKGCTITAGNSFSANGIGYIDNYIAILMPERPNNYGDEKKGFAKKVKNFTLINESSAQITGIYLGHKGSYTTEQTSTVNFSSSSYVLENISIQDFYRGVNLRECWDTTFKDIRCNNCQICIDNTGQSVNNKFINCVLNSEYRDNSIGFHSTIIAASPIQVESQGLTFTQCNIFNCAQSIVADRGFEIIFMNCIIDLASENAIVLSNLANSYKFIGCFIAGGSPVILLNYTDAYQRQLMFSGCSLNGVNEQTMMQINNTLGVIITGCAITGLINGTTNSFVLLDGNISNSNPVIQNVPHLGMTNTLNNQVITNEAALQQYTRDDQTAEFLFNQLFNKWSSFTTKMSMQVDDVLNAGNSAFWFDANAQNNPAEGYNGIGFSVQIGAQGFVIVMANNTLYVNYKLSTWRGWTQK